MCDGCRLNKVRLRIATTVPENQFEFTPERSTMEAIFLGRPIEIYSVKRSDLRMIFINLKKQL